MATAAHGEARAETTTPPPALRARRRLPSLWAGKRRAMMMRLLACGAARIIMAFVIAALVRDIVAMATSETVAGGSDGLALATAALTTTALALLVLRVLERTEAERLGQDYVAKVRLRLFARLTATPLRDDTRPRLGLTMNRMITDLGALKNWVSLGVARALVASISVLGCVAAIASLSMTAAAAATAMIALFVTLLAALTPRLRYHVREARRCRGRIAGRLGDVLPALASVVRFGHARQEWQRLRRRSHALAAASVRRTGVGAVPAAFPDAVYPSAVAVMAWFVSAGTLEIDELIGTLALLGLMSAGLRDLARAWAYRVSFEEARRRLDTLMAQPVLSASRDAQACTVGDASEVRLVHVAHGPLHDAHTTIERGERVAIAGPSGAGKSTLLALMARFCDPREGGIRLDGQRLARIPIHELAARVQLVSPEVPLMRGTVESNLRAACPSESVLRHVLSLCDISESERDIAIGEGAHNVADGLRARVALARALMPQPGLLLLDDVTLLTDAVSRHALERVLARVPATVVIALPDGISVAVDRVLTLSAGAMVETTSASENSAEPTDTARCLQIARARLTDVHGHATGA